MKLKTRIEFLNIKNFVCRRLPRNFLYYKNDLKSDLNIFIKGKYIRFPYFRGVLKRGDYPLFLALFTVVVLMHAFTLCLRAVNTKMKTCTQRGTGCFSPQLVRKIESQTVDFVIKVHNKLLTTLDTHHLDENDCFTFFFKLW